MQTSYLRYMIEIDRTRSITQAAANLYLSQPNLSRILRETEAQLGFSIFERSSRGVRPTEAGVAFLRHAKRVLHEMEAIEGLGVGRGQTDRFRVCMPRSAGMLALTIEYLNALPPDRPLDAILRECHVRQAFDDVSAGELDLGVVRFRAEYQDYFEDQAAGDGLRFELLNRYRCRVILRRDNPLAQKASITLADLSELTEITHGDTFRARDSRLAPAQNARSSRPRRRIYSVDRHAQLTLISRVPDAFMWTSPLRAESLAPWNLVQREVEDNDMEYRHAMIHAAPDALNDIERDYMDFIRQRCVD